MGILEIEDSSGKIEVVCFPRTWASIPLRKRARSSL